MPSLSQPLYGASIGQAITRFFKKYATFSGRASRSEYWWVYLMNSVIGMVLVFALLPSNPDGARFDAGFQQQQQEYLPYPQAENQQIGRASCRERVF